MEVICLGKKDVIHISTKSTIIIIMEIYKFITNKRNKALYSFKMFDIIIKSMFQQNLHTILFLHHDGFKSKAPFSSFGFFLGEISTTSTS